MKVKAKVPLYPHQHEFVMCDEPRVSLIGGYGSGKSFSAVQRTLRLLELRKGKAFIFYAAPTYDLIYTTYYPELIETLEKYHIKYHEDKLHHAILIDTPELKGTIKLVSLEKYKNLIGFTATDGILDEFDTIAIERQRQIWTRALARLRGAENGTLAITTTPEGHKLCYELWKAGKIKQITASTTDNKSLPESFINDMMECYDEAHVAMYINGQYVNLAGLRAMYNYREDLLIEPIAPEAIPHNLTVGMDFNVDPFCLTVSFTNEQGEKITFDELYINNTGGTGGYASFTDKAMMLLLQRYPNLWYQQNVDKDANVIHDISVRPDMTGIARKTASNLTDIAILRKYGVTILGTSNPPVSSRIKVANMALQKGLWKVSKNCKHLIEDMEMCVTDEHGELMKDDPKRTHILDACTYDVFQDFKHLIFKKTPGREL